MSSAATRPEVRANVTISFCLLDRSFIGSKSSLTLLARFLEHRSYRPIGEHDSGSERRTWTGIRIGHNGRHVIPASKKPGDGFLFFVDDTGILICRQAGAARDFRGPYLHRIEIGQIDRCDARVWPHGGIAVEAVEL